MDKNLNTSPDTLNVIEKIMRNSLELIEIRKNNLNRTPAGTDMSNQN